MAPSCRRASSLGSGLSLAVDSEQWAVADGRVRAAPCRRRSSPRRVVSPAVESTTRAGTRPNSRDHADPRRDETGTFAANMWPTHLA